jgi:hypothetical protein
VLSVKFSFGIDLSKFAAICWGNECLYMIENDSKNFKKVN